MALVVDVQRFCILRVKVKKHKLENCPQCKALTALAIDVNNKTLDMIAEVFGQVKPGEMLDPGKTKEHILALKTGPTGNGYGG